MSTATRLSLLAVFAAAVWAPQAADAQPLTVTCTFSRGDNTPGHPPPRGTTLTVVGPPNTAIKVFGGFGTDLGGQVSPNGATTDANGQYTLFIAPASTVFRVEVGAAGAVKHYRRIIRGNVNRAWPEGRDPNGGGNMMMRIDGLPLSADVLAAAGLPGQGGVLELRNNSSDRYALTSLSIYRNLSPTFFDGESFDSAAAIGTGFLAYQETVDPTGDESQFVTLAPEAEGGAIGLAIEGLLSGYDLVTGTAAIRGEDGSLGEPVPFSFAQRAAAMSHSSIHTQPLLIN